MNQRMKKIIITIGRQFGGGGKGVADVLGKKLGIPVYDSELIAKAAQDSGFSAELFVQSDEKRRFFSLHNICKQLFRYGKLHERQGIVQDAERNHQKDC